ncbi:GAS2-like protein 3 isoform X1 [Pieris rapae]|uniref:GAS2-like protein 3 isoform X1 n=1 Tax=Pieris rapae TaxID=64459 RepID=UPI001E27AAA5|nr:GAS2-like protein 3 isoform X1 [Pieris rapae]XP_045489392.1 GAS2-like protein 3 isoform X1 [Pieris rapae]XP_045489393.1 GAS2-like protein 3 isoform X1 [Pieris rapae]
MAFYRCGPTAIGSRASWSVTSPDKTYERPLSGNYDRIFNAFERTNAFEYVKSTFEGKEERHTGCGEVVVNRRMSSSFERADCALAAQTPCSEDEEFYKEKVLYSQARQLFPLQEDLADWINKIIGITYLTGENFLDVLDNGVELCQLAAVIHDRAREALDQGIIVGPVPAIRGRCWQRAARRSFFSRDNAENFITFCRELGVHENLLFESDDLVLHNQPRQVILCLLEVARLATKFNVEPPGLVALEKEIALEERDSGLDSAMSGAAWQFRDSSPPLDKPTKKEKQTLEPNETSNCSIKRPTVDPRKQQIRIYINNPFCLLVFMEFYGIPFITNEVCVEDSVEVASTRSDSSSDTDVPLRPTNELDKRVQSITRLLERGCRCGSGKCSRLLKVKKVGEGRYNIAGRNVFIRLLKGRHMMVRVGGGWDTLEHFLSRHEPCQVRLVTPGRRDLLPLAPTPASNTAKERTSPSPTNRISPNRTTTSPSTTEKITPRNSVSPSSSKTSLKESSVSPAHSKASIDSPVEPFKQKSKNTPKTSTPNKPVVRNRSALTLPLNEKPRKQSAPASFSTPNTPINRPEQRKSVPTPKKSRSMSLALQNDKKFCGTERLNQARKSSVPDARKTRSQSLASTPINEPKKLLPTYGKKTRSMSLATTNDFPKPLKKSLSASSTPVTQAAIEESIRLSLEATIADPTSPKKPFLHIKAKYRSPPPREVPPR